MTKELEREVALMGGLRDKEPIYIDSEVRVALRDLLSTHPRFRESGIGYSEFIRRAVVREQETPEGANLGSIAYVSRLADRAHEPEVAMNVSALRTQMRLVQAEAQAVIDRLDALEGS